jgi:thiol-disulfide isomerase/thioredoxin
MKKIIPFMVLAALCLFLEVNAQEKNQHRYLTVGDTMPDITISNLLNFHAHQAKISDFKGKLLILDFWATWCGTCLKQFPHSDSLAVEFKNDLTIILVNSELRTGDNLTKIKYTFSDRPKPEHLLIAYNDTTLRNLVKYHSLPHYVWISPSGVICAITDHFQVTRKNIREVLNGTQVNMPLKEDH